MPFSPSADIGQLLCHLPNVSNENLKHVLIVGGEASGDLHGANLVRAIKDLNPDIRVQGIGGKNMEEAGVEILIPSSDMAVVGLTEVFSRLNTIIRASLNLKSLLKKSPPDLLILIDYPDFNINLARTAKKCGVPVLYYISPQVWAWRRGRVKKITERVDRMAVILPFEEEFYLKNTKDIRVDYVGHPLMDIIPEYRDRDDIKTSLGIKEGGPVLGLLPGSRNEEIKNLLPSMIGAAEILSTRFNNIKCLLPIAPTISPDLIESMTGRSVPEVIVWDKDMYSALSICDLALVASGTATLETAIMGVPMVIAYKISPMSFWIGKKIIKVRHIGLVNLVAGEEVAPEVIQNEVSAQGLADKALKILENEDLKADMVKKLNMVKERLGGPGAAKRTAQIAMEMMNKKIIYPRGR